MRWSIGRALVALALMCASMLGFAQAAGASSGCERSHCDGAVYGWHVGDDFLHQAVGAPEGDQAMASNGDVVTVEGTGAFSLHPRAASGGGTFKHKMAATGEVATGTFQVREVKSFESFGNGTPQGTPPNFFGGRLKLLVDLTPDKEPWKHFKGLLTVNCALGNPPPGVEEGIMLKVFDLIDFDKTVHESGQNVFVLL
ncbi:hypothetical protein [Kitasatospora sp. NPDC093558]|uniref:hypothetical protein n=1 Tax=Kitasatospora sp. NPDC093558 TaxID=3155201 RepID=UPI00341FD56F